MAEFFVAPGDNIGTDFDDIFLLDEPVGEFYVDGLDGNDEFWANIAAFTTDQWSFDHIESLIFYGGSPDLFYFNSGSALVDLSATESLVVLTSNEPDMTVFGGAFTYVAISDDTLAMDYFFETGLLSVQAGDETQQADFFDIKGIIGGLGDDFFVGDERDNDFLPGLGFNEVSGGDGLDRVVLFASEFDPETTFIFRDGDEVIVEGEGTETVATEVERVVLVTDDIELLAYFAFDTGVGENAGTAYRTYQAAFDRVPDIAGLGFWIDQLDNGMSFEQMCAYFLESDEFQQLYGANPTSEDYVAALYANVLQRDGDPAGIEFWEGVLDSGEIERDELLLFFADSEENIALVAPAIEDGIFIG